MEEDWILLEDDVDAIGTDSGAWRCRLAESKGVPAERAPPIMIN